MTTNILCAEIARLNVERERVQLSYDETVEMLRLADDLAGGEVSDLDTQQTSIIIRALRRAAGADGEAEQR